MCDLCESEDMSLAREIETVAPTGEGGVKASAAHGSYPERVMKVFVGENHSQTLLKRGVWAQGRMGGEAEVFGGHAAPQGSLGMRRREVIFFARLHQ